MRRSVVAFVVMIGAAGSGHGQGSSAVDIMTEKQTLANEPGMAVSVEMPSLPGYSFRPDVENALRQAGMGRSTWTIKEVRPGKVEADEQWTRFTSGRNSYTGTITGRMLEVKTGDLGGYSINFSLGGDNAGLTGQYVGHPSQCQTVNLRKVR